jgi:hypothetical protein
VGGCATVAGAACTIQMGHPSALCLALVAPPVAASPELLLPPHQAVCRQPPQRRLCLCIRPRLPQRLCQGPEGRLVLAAQQALKWVCTGKKEAEPGK